MNDSLINAHRGQLKHPLAIQLYDAMLADAMRNPETDNMQVELILHNIAILEDQKQALLQDIQTRGVNVPFQQGKQKIHILWNYTAGILDKRSGSFGFDNVSRLTGFSMGEYPIGGIAEHADSCYPVVYIRPDEAILPLEYYSDGQIKTAKRRDCDGRTHILSAMPRDMTVESARKMLTATGVHLYAPAYCTVNGDNRFLYVLAEKKMCAEIALREPATCRNEFTGEIFKNASTISAEMEEGTCIFLKYIRE